MSATRWPAIAAARHDPWASREPLRIAASTVSIDMRAGSSTTAADGFEASSTAAPALVARVGSVSRDAPAALLRQLAPWLRHGEDGWWAEGAPEQLEERFASLHAALRERGLITGWRDEAFAVTPAGGGPVLARIERAASRFWGTLTLGAHANGYVADDSGRPTHLWIAERSPHKPTDPGKLDNLVGGGVPAGQTPFETLLREGWEEAGLDEPRMRRCVRGLGEQSTRPVAAFEIQRPLPDCAGLGWQWERVHAWDLRLEPGQQPRNQDGEVAALRLLPVAEAIELAHGDAMTVDAALVTLDFALRHRLLDAGAAGALAATLAPLRPAGEPPG